MPKVIRLATDQHGFSQTVKFKSVALGLPADYNHVDQFWQVISPPRLRGQLRQERRCRLTTFPKCRKIFALERWWEQKINHTYRVEAC